MLTNLVGILDNVNVRQGSSNSTIPVWSSVVTFFAAHVVWAKLRSEDVDTRDRHGTMKLLGMFRAELQALTWPCCVEMVKTLERLMHE